MIINLDIKGIPIPLILPWLVVSRPLKSFESLGQPPTQN
jgi:hypothetical protein